MASALERAARAAWGEIVSQNGENSGRYAGTYAGRPNYVEGFIDPVALARAVLMAVRDLDDETRQRGSEIYCTKGSGLFTSMIDAILNEKDTTND